MENKMSSVTNNNVPHPHAQGTVETGKVEFKTAREKFLAQEAAHKAKIAADTGKPIPPAKHIATQPPVKSAFLEDAERDFADTLPTPPDLSKMPPVLDAPLMMNLPLPPPPPAEWLQKPAITPDPLLQPLRAPRQDLEKASDQKQEAQPQKPTKIGGALAYLGTLAHTAKESVAGLGTYFKKSPATETDSVHTEDSDSSHSSSSDSEHSVKAAETAPQAAPAKNGGTMAYIGTLAHGLGDLFKKSPAKETDSAHSDSSHSSSSDSEHSVKEEAKKEETKKVTTASQPPAAKTIEADSVHSEDSDDDDDDSDVEESKTTVPQASASATAPAGAKTSVINQGVAMVKGPNDQLMEKLNRRRGLNGEVQAK